MSNHVHIANTNVEFEFAHSSSLSLEEALSQHPVCLQLQFLPLLYAKPQDIVAVTALPDKKYLATLQETGWWTQGIPLMVPLKKIKPFQGKQCLAWGPSQQVQAWAAARHMRYLLPHDWQTICQVNSKAFSFRYTCLSQAALVHHEQELLNWIQKNPGPKVLKSCFGLSGKGNWLIKDNGLSPKILAFCYKEWQHKRPILAEPWLDRVADFSTQWLIHPNQEIEWIGATRFETDAKGTYQATLAGPEDILFSQSTLFLQQHRQYAQKALNEMAALGFFGPVGLDALLYRDSQTHSICLYPIVEINARQTMSLVALRLQQRISPHQILRLAFSQHSSSVASLLPDQLTDTKGKPLHFRRSLFATLLPTLTSL